MNEEILIELLLNMAVAFIFYMIGRYHEKRKIYKQE